MRHINNENQNKANNAFIKTFINGWFVMFVFAISTLQVFSSDAANAPEGNIIAGKIAKLKQQDVFNNETKIFSVTANTGDENITAVVSDYTLLNIDHTKVSGILDTKPDYLKLVVPIENGSRNFTLLLYRTTISPGEFNLLTSDGRVNQPDNRIVHYRGSIENDSRSVVSMTFSENETMGVICTSNGNYVLGKIKNNTAGKFIIYNDNNLIPRSGFKCETNTAVSPNLHRIVPPNSSTTTVNCVNWYWEIDYDIYVDKGSLANVNSYMQGVFNQVSTIYANDGITINLQTLYVWTTVDPYTGPSTMDYLNQFGSYRTTFSGDAAHLIGYNGGGGIAWVDGICSVPQFDMAYSGISSSYNNVPTFSWTVECIAHEEGHVLGSQHTHDCVWNGNNTPIDGCGPAAGYAGTGSCATGPYPPTTGGHGTIMSYCHLNVGIDFTLGFGPQPTTLIVNNINTSSCLSPCGGCVPPGQPGAISGSTAMCPGSSQTYSVSAVTGATGYTWTIPAGWSGSSTTNSITATAGASGGSISVTANDSCGSSTASTLAVTVSSTVPAQPGTISGTASMCPGSSQTYSVSSVSGATDYTWTVPAGWSGSSTTGSITVTAGGSGGNLSVTANNSCGSSTARTLAVTVGSTVPAQPGAISGSSSMCESTTQTYSVSAVAGATDYTWTVPAGWSGSSTTNSILVTSGISAGNISVKANNSCGSSSVQNTSVAITQAPSQPGAISGNASACQSSVETYSASAVAGATSYTWTLPAGWSGVSSTASITVTAGTSGGNITVKANNSCGSSSAKIKTVTVTQVPNQPAAVSGNPAVCPGSTQTYSVGAVAGATGYTWTFPSGWIGSSTTNSITAEAGMYGTISVTADNSCGSSSAQSFSVSVFPTTSLSISQTGDYVVVSPVSSTDTIQWYYESAMVACTNDSLYCQGTGNYQCVIINSYGCSTSSPVLNVTTTGIIENSSGDYMIFPNPATDFIKIQNTGDTSLPVLEFSLFNVEGKKILVTKISEASSVIELKHMASGFYFYQLNDGIAILKSGKLVILKKDE